MYKNVLSENKEKILEQPFSSTPANIKLFTDNIQDQYLGFLSDDIIFVVQSIIDTDIKNIDGVVTLIQQGSIKHTNIVKYAIHNLKTEFYQGSFSFIIPKNTFLILFDESNNGTIAKIRFELTGQHEDPFTVTKDFNIKIVDFKCREGFEFVESEKNCKPCGKEQMYHNQTKSCISCPVGANCTNPVNVTSLHQYYMIEIKSNEYKFVECPNPYACIGGEDKCRDGYENILCLGCKEGFVKKGFYECIQCHNNYYIVFLYFVGILCLIIVFILVSIYKFKKWERKNKIYSNSSNSTTHIILLEESIIPNVKDKEISNQFFEKLIFILILVANVKFIYNQLTYYNYYQKDIFNILLFSNLYHY